MPPWWLPRAWPAALLLCGCEQVLGTDLYGVAKPQWTEVACGACVDATCDPKACDEDPTCAPYAACVRACARTAGPCRAACYDRHARDAAGMQGLELQRFDTCFRETCGDHCVEGAGYHEERGAACEACMRGACAEDLDACARDAACEASVTCMGNTCRNPNCRMVCVDDAHRSSDVCSGTPPLVHAVGVCRNSCGADCGFGHDWSCAGDYEWRVATEAVRRSFAIVHSAGASTPYAGVSVAVCAKHDPGCEEPFDAGISDDDGRVCLSFSSVGTGFDGFLALRAPEDGHETLYFVRHPVTSILSGDLLIVPTGSAVRAILGFLGVEPEPSRAHVAAIIHDCTDAPAKGVIFEIDIDDPDVVPFYARSNIVTAAASSTDETGVGGFANLPVTGVPATVRARVEATGELVAEQLVVLEGGALTIVSLTPLPR